MEKIARREVLVLGGLGVAVAIGARLGLGCQREGTTPPDRGRIVADLAANVIVPAYEAAAVEAEELEAATAALRDAPSASTLTAARDAWREARRTWKATDAFLFGPASDLTLVGGAIDTPADLVKVEALAADDGRALDADVVAGLGANQRGLPGVEALLFDPSRDDAAMLAAFEGGRRGGLAALVAADLRAKVVAVRDAWTGDYAAQLSTAGRGSRLYATERQAIDAVVNGLIAGAEVVIAVRLAKPLGLDRSPPTPLPSLLESPRSDASVDDILAVLDGIDAVYLGRRGGLPLAHAVAERTPAGDARMKDLLERAKAAVRAIPGPLRTAVVERREPVIAAHAAVREVKRCLSTDVAGALGTAVGFNVTDGD